MTQATSQPASVPDPEEADEDEDPAAAPPGGSPATDTTEDFAAFYARMLELLFLLAARSCPPEVARDVVQDVMVSIYRRWDLIVPQTRDNYARTAVRNAVAGWHGNVRTRRETGGLEPEHVDAGRARSMGHDSPVEQAVTGRDLAARAADVINTHLSVRETEVITMSVMGMKPGEIAGELDMAGTSVRTVLSRARKKLRTVFDHREGGDLDA